MKMWVSIILTYVLYVRTTWWPSWKGRHKLQIFANKMCRQHLNARILKYVSGLGCQMTNRIFVCKNRVVLLGRWRIWWNLWAGNVAKMGSAIN